MITTIALFLVYHKLKAMFIHEEKYNHMDPTYQYELIILNKKSDNCYKYGLYAKHTLILSSMFNTNADLRSLQNNSKQIPRQLSEETW